MSSYFLYFYSWKFLFCWTFGILLIISQRCFRGSAFIKLIISLSISATVQVIHFKFYSVSIHTIRHILNLLQFYIIVEYRTVFDTILLLLVACYLQSLFVKLKFIVVWRFLSSLGLDNLLFWPLYWVQVGSLLRFLSTPTFKLVFNDFHPIFLLYALYIHSSFFFLFWCNCRVSFLSCLSCM